MVKRHGAGSVAGRVMTILDTFRAEHPTMSLSEISRRSGIPLATTYRLVGELAARGALERDTSGRYRIGLWLWEVATLAPRTLGLREVAMPFLEDLYEATHENVQLAVLDGAEVVYIERISGRGAVPVHSRTGVRWAVHATGVGLVLLAFADPATQERVLRAPLRTFTEKTIADPKKLRSVLADTRQSGIAISDRQVTMDALSVAAPVRGPDGSVVAAVSVVVHHEGAMPNLLAPAVRAAGRGISRALGWTAKPLSRREPSGGGLL